MRAESISPLAAKSLQGRLRNRSGEFLVGLNSQLRLRDVICRYKGRLEVGSGTDILSLIDANEIEAHRDVNPRGRSSPLQFFHSLLQYLTIQIKSDVDDM